MEILLVVILVGIFLGPTAYRLYERFKRPTKAGPAVGPSWGRRMLGMLLPVFVMAFFLSLLGAGLYYLAGR